LETIEIDHLVFRNWQQCEVEHKGDIYKKIKLKQMRIEFNEQFPIAMPEFNAHCLRVTLLYFGK